MKHSISFGNNKNIIFHSQPRVPCSLMTEKIDLWLADADSVPNFSLSVEEQRKMNAMKLPFAAHRFESTRKLLRYLFETYLNCSQCQIATTDQGKPFLPAFPEFHFNVTHSKKMIMVALARSPIGIDLERERKLDVLRIAKRFFSLSELLVLQKKDPAQQQQIFFKLWTAKEAALKADGQGIAFGMKNNLAVMKGENISSIELEDQSWKISSWSFLEGEENFFGAMATSFTPTLLHWYDLRPGTQGVSSIVLNQDSTNS